MTVMKEANPDFKIPTVNIAPYLADPTSTEALKIVNQVREACTTTGFFQLIGHEISRSLQDEVLAGIAAFFTLPLEQKKKLDKSDSVGASNRGYELIGDQSLQEGTLPDLKEVRSIFCPSDLGARKLIQYYLELLYRQGDPGHRSKGAE